MFEWQDLRHTVRMLWQQRGFAAAAIVTLGLGIGATTAIFSVVYGVLINPLPYRNPDALVRIVHAIGGVDQPYFSDAVFVTYVDNTQAFQDVGVWEPDTTATITGRGDPDEVRSWTLSRGVLTTLGVQPVIGRWFSSEDDTRGAPDTVMLAHDYWQREFGGDRGVLGQMLQVDARPHQIIGVMPASVRLGGDHDIILPLRIDRARPGVGFRLLGLARLKPDVMLEQANADVTRILRIWLANTGKHDPEFQARYQPALRPLHQDIVGDVGSTLWVLMGAIAIVLLLACANVANLLLVRADARRRELAIRAALGASWRRLARQLLVESLTLAVLGGVLGVAFAYGSVRLLHALGPANLPRLAEISMDVTTLGFAVAISLLSGLLFGLIPVVKHARPRLTAMIDAAGRGATQPRERQRSQHVLVVAQMALALMLLVSSGLMIRSFQALREVDPGFAAPHRVQTFGLSIPRTVVADPERMTRVQQDILDRIAAIPGVESAAFMNRLPMDPTDRASSALSAEGAADDGRTPPNRQVKVISPEMFRTLGIPLIEGRDFTWTDAYDRRDVAIVSENLAREFWGSAAAAIGKRVREYYVAKGPWREIVGVAANVHDDGAHQAPPATIYWLSLHPRLFGVPGYTQRRVQVAVRSDRAGTESLLAEIRQAVWAVNGDLPLAQVQTLGEVYDRSMARTSFTLVMLALAGAMALLLGVFGIYGVIAYAVSLRRREIGIRLALGAQRGEIQRLFLRRGIVLMAVGVALGVGGAAAFTQLMQSLLFGVDPLDPVTFAAMPIVLAAAATLASYLPARRALAVDPVETLRAE